MASEATTTLNSFLHGEKIIVSKSTISTSKLWDIQKRWHENHAIQAWQSGKLPHWISSNTFIAAKYANMILSFARDVWSKSITSSKSLNSTQHNQPIHIVELGAGHGKLGFLILKHLVSLREFWPASNCFRYVLTDYTTSIINFWKNHPSLLKFFNDGLLDYAKFDCETEDAIHLIRTGITLNRSTLQRPVVFVSNYVFSSLKQDHFQFFSKDDDTTSTIKKTSCTITM
jgi:hypothetical protein